MSNQPNMISLMTLLDIQCRTFSENFHTESFYKVKRYIKKYINKYQLEYTKNFIICNSIKDISKYKTFREFSRMHINLDTFDFSKPIHGPIFKNYITETKVYSQTMDYLNNYILELEDKIKDKYYRKYKKSNFENCGIKTKRFWKVTKKIK